MLLVSHACLCRTEELQDEAEDSLPDKCGGGAFHRQQPANSEDVLPARRSLHVPDAQLQHSMVDAQFVPNALFRATVVARWQNQCFWTGMLHFLAAKTESLFVFVCCFFNAGLNHLQNFMTSIRDRTTAWQSLERWANSFNYLTTTSTKNKDHFKTVMQELHEKFFVSELSMKSNCCPK